MEQNGTFLYPLLVAFAWLRGLIPTSLSKPSISFITIHYMYIIGMTIIASVIVYPRGLRYIDALFFAAGSATQSGLNSVDVNQLEVYQQVTFYLTACVCTPVWIHSTLVVVRLYWFEKRFAKLVNDQRSLRKLQAKTLTRSKSEARSIDLEGGNTNNVGGRSLPAMTTVARPQTPHAGEGAFGLTNSTRLEKDVGTDERSISPSDPADSHHGSRPSDTTPSNNEDPIDIASAPDVARSHKPQVAKFHREITFADEIAENKLPQDVHASSAERLPEKGSDMARHIEFLERQQRNAHREGGTLRIPGPRDFDRGAVPQELDDSDDNDVPVQRSVSNDTGDYSPTTSRHVNPMLIDKNAQSNDEDHITGHRAITIDLPDHPRRRASDAGTNQSSPTFLSRIRTGLTNRPSSAKLSMQKVKDNLGRSFSRYGTNASVRSEDPMPYLSWQATTGRNSAFMGLTSEQRDELGGIEYRSLKMLLKILIGYFFGFHILGVIVFVPWILHTHWRETVLPQYAVNPTWWAIFTSASMFNDLGLTLTPTSMNEFNTATLPLLFGSYLIVIGNTGFPCMLRFMIWIISKFYPRNSPGWDELRFLLDHPRRCFTLLFPSRATWWLFWILVLLNGIDLVFFIILDLNDSVVTAIPAGFRVLDGWFQAVSTRTAGFSCINLAGLHPAIQVSYLIMMYISVFPIAISVRRTNVYEEKSLGIWGGEESAGEEQDQSYVGQHLRRQLSFDLWYVFLGFFIIAIVEGDRIADNAETGFTMFAVLFEIVSAYGTVGLSLGYPGINASFSAEFRVISKLIIIAMMIRGRHRGLPYALDRAILLPSDKLNKKDEDVRRMPTRRASAFSETYANAYESHNIKWDDGLLDQNGLPLQHTGMEIDPMTAGAGGERGPDNLRRVNRRTSDMEQERRSRRRSRSLGQVIVGGLSAGPTLPRHID